jgi:hypothetical protein
MNRDRTATGTPRHRAWDSPGGRQLTAGWAGERAIEGLDGDRQTSSAIVFESPGGEAVEGLRPLVFGEFIRCTARLQAEGDRVTAAIEERLKSSLPGWLAASAFGETEAGEHLRASLAAQIESFRAGALPLACPNADAACAVLAAKFGSLGVLLAGYSTLQSGIWQAWLEIVDDDELAPETRDELLGHGLDFISRYFEAVRGFVMDVFQDTLEQIAGDSEQRRLNAVRAILEAKPNTGEPLGVELEQHHLGLIAEGAGGAAAARGLAKALGRPILLVGPIGRSWWGWVSGSQPLTPLEEEALGSFEPGKDAQLAIGFEAFGAEGFRSTHKQALRAQAVGGHTPKPLIYFGDVAVAALSAADPGDARAFVEHELRGIDAETPGDQRIRETILAYFVAGHNAASASAALGVHQQTVTNRLLAAEERLGRSVASRRVELETALRLRSLFGASA